MENATPYIMGFLVHNYTNRYLNFSIGNRKYELTLRKIDKNRRYAQQFTCPKCEVVFAVNSGRKAKNCPFCTAKLSKKDLML